MVEARRRSKFVSMDRRLFARRLRQYRTNAGLDQAELARRTGITASYVSHLEKGQRLPSLSIVLHLASALGLQTNNRDSLLEAAGHKHSVDPVLDDELFLLRKLFDDSAITSEERNELMLSVHALAARWTSLRKVRKQKVRRAVLVTAGWQPRLLSPQSLERTLLHAADEIVRAGITDICVVIAPDTPANTFDNFRNNMNASETTATWVVQEQPLGLGNAILIARHQIEGGPFAVVLPDDIDPSRKALHEMVECYEANHWAVLAVNPGPIRAQHPETRFYGMATLKAQQGEVCSLRQVCSVSEKPLNTVKAGLDARMIAGRYVLPPDILEDLQAITVNQRTGKFELTDAIALALRSKTVLALELERPMLPLAPVRSVIELLVESIDDPTKFERVLRLTEKLFRDISKI
jgi:UTP-glucose-1-phosphate uridylyltransferase/transcriptional regulator with XRE-family HTH domain